MQECAEHLHHSDDRVVGRRGVAALLDQLVDVHQRLLGAAP
jgi:hypothetical protein